MREEKRGCKERSFNFSLQSTKIGWLSSDGPRFKVGVLGEGYTWIHSKFCQGFARKVQEVESFGFRKCLHNFLGSLLMLQELWILPTLVIFHSIGCLVEF